MSFTLIRRAMNDFKLMPSVHALNILRMPCNLYAWLSLRLSFLQLRRIGRCSLNNTSDKWPCDFQTHAMGGGGLQLEPPGSVSFEVPRCVIPDIGLCALHFAVWTLTQSEFILTSILEVGRGWVTNYPFTSQETEAREVWVACQS